MMPRDPFREMIDRMGEVFRDLEHEFPDVDGGTGRVPVDVQETDDEVVVRADMPGVETDRIHVRADTDRLEIAADDEQEVVEEQANYTRRERSTRRFQRTVRLPAPVDPDSAEASYEDGVLTVTLQKAEGTGTRDVPVE